MTKYIEVITIQHVKKIYKIKQGTYIDKKHLIDAVENSELNADYSNIISEDIINRTNINY